MLFFISQLSSERTLVQMFCEITRRLFTLLLLEQLLLLNSKSHVRITKTREYNINNKVKKKKFCGIFLVKLVYYYSFPPIFVVV